MLQPPEVRGAYARFVFDLPQTVVNILPTAIGFLCYLGDVHPAVCKRGERLPFFGFEGWNHSLYPPILRILRILFGEL